MPVNVHYITKSRTFAVLLEGNFMHALGVMASTLQPTIGDEESALLLCNAST